MRTTVDINQDLLERIRKIADDEGISFKEALNRAITRGLAPAAAAAREPFRQQTFNLGVNWDAKAIKEFLHEEEMERYLKTQRRSPSE
jgi:hypothetical protein